MYSIRKGFKYQMTVMLGEFSPRNEHFFNILLSIKEILIKKNPSFLIIKILIFFRNLLIAFALTLLQLTDKVI
jgi:hypothetical protein